METGFFKITLRGIIHNRLISFITIAGLAIGLAGSVFIGLWVSDELGFDSKYNQATGRTNDRERGVLHPHKGYY